MRPFSFADALRIVALHLDRGDELVRKASNVMGTPMDPGDDMQEDLRKMAEALYDDPELAKLVDERWQTLDEFYGD